MMRRSESDCRLPMTGLCKAFGASITAYAPYDHSYACSTDSTSSTEQWSGQIWSKATAGTDRVTSEPSDSRKSTTTHRTPSSQNHCSLAVNDFTWLSALNTSAQRHGNSHKNLVSQP